MQSPTQCDCAQESGGRDRCQTSCLRVLLALGMLRKMEVTYTSHWAFAFKSFLHPRSHALFKTHRLFLTFVTHHSAGPSFTTATSAILARTRPIPIAPKMRYSTISACLLSLTASCALASPLAGWNVKAIRSFEQPHALEQPAALLARATSTKKAKSGSKTSQATASATAPATTAAAQAGSGSGGAVPASSGTSVLKAVQTIAAGDNFDGGLVAFE